MRQWMVSGFPTTGLPEMASHARRADTKTAGTTPSRAVRAAATAPTASVLDGGRPKHGQVRVKVSLTHKP